jgi:hypothetical protein
MNLAIARLTLACVAVAVPLTFAPPLARAQDDERMSAMERQINALQQELARMRQEQARRDNDASHAAHEAAAPRRQTAQTSRPVALQGTTAPPQMEATLPAVQPDTPPKSPPGEFHAGGLTIKLGGFLEAAGIFRSRNEVADISSSWIAIPYRNLPQAYESELRGSPRQSRASVLLQGAPDSVTTLSGYVEVDLQGAAPTSNSNESDSYTPRLRQAYIGYDRSDLGLHVLAGQSWSLLTMFDKGIIPRREAPPITIDGQYLPGFTCSTIHFRPAFRWRVRRRCSARPATRPRPSRPAPTDWFCPTDRSSM